jgi:uncharacterized protein YjiS (DUF1127 family)
MSIQLVEVGPVEAGARRIAPQPRSSPLIQPLNILRRWMRRGAQRRALRDLAQDGRLLSDIGLTRSQALREADKLFWRP